MAMGELSSFYGEQGVSQDLKTRRWDHYGKALTALESLREPVADHIRTFARGIDDFYTQHPDQRPEWWGTRTIEPAMILAFQRFFLMNWSIDDAYDELRRIDVVPEAPRAERGSNQFAVAPSRSASGSAILAIDPHLRWSGPSRFWEIRIHAGALSGCGVTLPGIPYIGLGHTRHIAWAMATGGPDTADVFTLELNPQDRTRYRYEGEWRKLRLRTVTVPIRGEEPRQFRLAWSHHGPIISMQGNRAYAARTAYDDRPGAIEAWFQLNMAQDVGGVRSALATLEFFPQNVMVADTAGNIYFQRTGRVPIRANGPDYSRPVDGTHAKTEWRGYHKVDDLVQLLNPPQGYMQNCNTPPDTLCIGAPLSPDKTRPYLYGTLEFGPLSGWINQRGARLVSLLHNDTSVTIEEAQAYINDLRPYGYERWVLALKKAAFEMKPGPQHMLALEQLMNWDGRLAANSSAALIYDRWRARLAALPEADRARLPEIDDFHALIRDVSPREPVLKEKGKDLLWRTFEQAVDQIIAHGSLDSVYGDYYRLVRGSHSWPVSGGEAQKGTETVRNLEFSPERNDLTRHAWRGQAATQIVILSRPPQSWNVQPWGQSDDPSSPHYRDQAEQLFSKTQLKPTWWLPEDLKNHIKSRTVLKP